MLEILVFSAGRSDFGILKKLIKKINLSKQFNLTLVIGPAHNTNIFGSTNIEINELRIKSQINLYFKKNNSNKFDILNSMSDIIKEISIKLKNKKYSAAIILGDRYESLIFALCCFNLRIPIIHIGGGSITLGSLDDLYRKCISQMSNLHFVETNQNKENLKNIGITKNVFITGAPAIENIPKKNNTKLIFDSKFDDYIYSKKKKILACFHPETNIPKKTNLNYLKNFILFLNNTNQKILFTYPNADEGYMEYIKIIESKLNKNNSIIVKNLGMQKYHSMLHHSDLLIGNSSSGIIESCSFKIACINLGNRQKKRLSPKNIIHSSFDIIDIKKAYEKAMSRNFKIKLKNFKNPYEMKNSSNKIFNIIKKFLKRINQ